MSSRNERCQRLAHPDIANFVVSCVILLGLVVSYLPQHWRIISRRSSEGLSPYFVLLGTTSGTCAIANILILPTSRSDIACCKVNDGFSCVAGLLGVAQIGVQWSCFFLIMFLFLIFLPRADNEYADRSTTVSSISGNAVEAIAVVAVSIVHFIITLLVSVTILAVAPNRSQALANVLGVMATILAAIQYVPQIWTTWQLQHVGSLSIPMMCIQTPGGFVFAGSLAARLGKEGWSTWAVYLILGTLQGILLAMAICFELRDRRLKKETRAEEHVTDSHFRTTRADSNGSTVRADEDSEDTPLLGDDNQGQKGARTASARR